jgi:nicotinamide-nucleotide amidase
MNLPNALTISRLAVIPVLMALLLIPFDYHDQVAAAVFVAFSMTDTMDGQIARRQGTVTDLGKFLDPLADKLFVVSVLVVLVQEGMVAAWVVVVILARELLITLLRTVAASRGRILAAAPLGKTKTVSQVVAVTLLILQRPYSVLGLPATLAVALAVVLTVTSGLDYLLRYRHLVGLEDATPGSSLRPLMGRLGSLLLERGLTVAVAESCTGGLVGAAFTDQPGSSAYFRGGITAYADQVKRDQLGVPGRMLAEHGAVSCEVAVAMAEGVRSRLGTDLSVSVTGIAGPDGGTPGKPVGLTYIAVATPTGTNCVEHNLQGDRWANRAQAARRALELLLAELEGAAREQVKSA